MASSLAILKMLKKFLNWVKIDITQMNNRHNDMKIIQDNGLLQFKNTRQYRE